MSGYKRAVAVGAAGELIVQARLLMRGWTVGNVNSGGMMNAPAVDLLAMTGSRKIAIAVKTTGLGSSTIVWNMKPGWTTLFKGEVRPDYVVFVWFTTVDDCRVFVVPADVVDRDVHEVHTHWHTHTKLDGTARAITSHVAIMWTGRCTSVNITRGFAERWARYENAWESLDQNNVSLG
jgi:hypothetical protein